MKDVTKNFKMWADLLDFGFEVALKSKKGNIESLKKILEYQGNLHHNANIEIFKKLKESENGKSSNSKDIK